MQKHPLDSKRLRQVPQQFSWVDHRLVRARLLRGTSTGGWALYLFLVTVGDEQGLSYYSTRSICEHLQVDPTAPNHARRELLERGLIAWRAPLYQVLDLKHLLGQHRTEPLRAEATLTAPIPEPISPEAGREESLRQARTLEQMLKGGTR